MISRRNCLRLSGAASIAGLANMVQAQDARTFPDRPIKLVVAKPPGGLDDSVARVLQPHLQKILGQPVVIENIAGANGIIGTQNVIRSQPDGYRLLVLNTRQQVTAGALMDSPPYDLTKELTPIVSFAEFRTAVIAHGSVPGKDLGETLRHAKANPHKVVYASTGPGSLAHLVLAMAARQVGAEMIHVPYKGGGPGSIAVMAGEAHLFFTDMNSAMNAVRTGRARIVAQSGRHRSKEAPEAPLFTEIGFDLFASAGSLALAGPAGMDPRIVEKIHAGVKQSFETSELPESIRNIGGEVRVVDGAALRADLENDMRRWVPQAKVIMAGK